MLPGRFGVTPNPSCPKSFLPQHLTLPSSCIQEQASRTRRMGLGAAPLREVRSHLYRTFLAWLEQDPVPQKDCEPNAKHKVIRAQHLQSSLTIKPRRRTPRDALATGPGWQIEESSRIHAHPAMSTYWAFSYHDRASMDLSKGDCLHRNSRPRRSHPSKQQHPHREEQQNGSSGRLPPGILRTPACVFFPCGEVTAARFRWLLYRKRRDRECQRQGL